MSVKLVLGSHQTALALHIATEQCTVLCPRNHSNMLALITFALLTVVNSQDDDSHAPKYPTVNVAYECNKEECVRAKQVFGYSSCEASLVINETIGVDGANSIASCGDFTQCGVYCFDEDKSSPTYHCRDNIGELLLFFFLALAIGTCCGGGGVYCYFKRKYGNDVSYIEISG